MNYSSRITKRIHLKFSYWLGLLFFVCCEMILPVKGWAQSFQDTGVFYFTGSPQPNRALGFRQRLPYGDGLKVGPVHLHPFLGVAEVYTDNVFSTNTKRRSDFLTTIAPGIQGYMPFGGKHSLLLDYRAAQFLYAKFTENNALTQNGLGHLALDFPGGLTINLQGRHLEAFDPRGSEFDSRQRAITKWNTDSFDAQAEFIGANIGIRVNASYLKLHFQNNSQAAPRDRSIANAGLTVFVPATATASALLGINVTNINYDRNNQLDNFSYGVFTGFRLAPSRQLSGELNVGYTILNYDRAPVSDPAQVQELSNEGLSTGAKQAKALYMSGNLRWRPTSRLDIRFTPFSSISQSAVFNTSTFRQTGAGINARQAITERVAIHGRFFYANDDFDTSRTDNRIRLRTELEYRTVDWLGFKLGYIFTKRFSNESEFEFYSNTVMLTVQGLLGTSKD